MKSKRRTIAIIIVALTIFLGILLTLASPQILYSTKNMINDIRLALGEGPKITITGIPDDTPIRGNIPIEITATSEKGISKIEVNGVEIAHTNGVANFIIEQNGNYTISATDGSGVINTQTIQISQIDKTPPTKTAPEATSTLNSITVIFKQTDSHSGISESKRYRLTNKDGTTGTWIETNQNEYTFEGLEDGVIYYVQTSSQDKVGNASNSEVTKISTQVPPLQELVTITKNPETEWAKQVIITVTVRDSGKYKVLATTDKTSFTETSRIVVEENTKVYAKLVNGDAEGELVEIAEVTNADNIPPTDTAPTTTITANKIVATCKQEDTLSGLNNDKTEYRLLGDENGNEIITNWQSSNTFSGLISEKQYYVQTRTEDILGNSSTSKMAGAKTLEITAGTAAQISYNSEWTNQDLVVTVTNPNNEYQMEISLDGNSWNTESPITFTENGKIYTRFTDGTNYGSVGIKEITNIDKVPPTSEEPTVIATENTLTVTNNQKDTLSGIQKIEYRFTTDESGSSSLSGYDWSTTKNYTNLVPDKTYYVQTRTTDKAGNITLSKIKKVNTTPITSTEGNLSFTVEPAEGWTKKVVVKFTITDETCISKYNLEISTDGQNYSQPENQTIEITENGPIYTRFSDGRYNGNGFIYCTIENIDNNPPTTVAPTGETTEEKIIITSNQEDNESGLKKTWYRLAKDETGTESLEGKDWQDSNTFSGLIANTTYYLQTKAEDNLENVSVSEVTEINTWTVPSIDNLKLTANPPSEWTKEDVIVTANYNQRDFKVQLSLDGINYETADQIAVPTNGTVYGRFINGELPGENVTTLPVINIDKTAPSTTKPEATATTRKIVVQNKQNDTQSGVKRVEYRLATDAEGTESLAKYDWKDNNVFDELDQNTKYYVQTRTEDNVGNMSESEILEITTSEVETAVGKITLIETPTQWTKDNVIVKADGTSEKYYIEMSTDGSTYEKTTQLEVSENLTVYARFSDGINSGEPVMVIITNIDKQAPTSTKPQAVATKIKITVTNKQTDSQSGINSSKTRYRLVKDVTGTESLEGRDWQESSVFNDLEADKEYFVQTKSEDNVGNESISEVTRIITESIPSAENNITYEKTPREWTNQEVIINFENRQSEYYIEYSVDRNTYEKIINNELQITDNCTIYVRLSNGISSGAEMPIIINNIDKVPPTLTMTWGDNIGLDHIEVNAKATDNQSGVKEIKYRLAKDKNDTAPVSNEDWKTNGIFTKLKENTTYYIQVMVTDNAGNTTTKIEGVTTRSSKLIITSKEYNVIENEKIITKIPVKTSIDEFKNEIEVNQNYTIVDSAGEEVTDGDMKTGYKVKTESAEYEIAVIGDIAPNGRLDVADLARMRAHIVGERGRILTGAYYYAADLNNDGNVSIIDLAKIRLLLVQ